MTGVKCMKKSIDTNTWITLKKFERKISDVKERVVTCRFGDKKWRRLVFKQKTMFSLIRYITALQLATTLLMTLEVIRGNFRSPWSIRRAAERIHKKILCHGVILWKGQHTSGQLSGFLIEPTRSRTKYNYKRWLKFFSMRRSLMTLEGKWRVELTK